MLRMYQAVDKVNRLGGRADPIVDVEAREAAAEAVAAFQARKVHTMVAWKCKTCRCEMVPGGNTSDAELGPDVLRACASLG